MLDTAVGIFGPCVVLFKNYLLIKFARNIQTSQFKEYSTESQIPFDVLLEDQRVVKSSYLTKVREDGKEQLSVQERLRIVHKRHKNPSLLSPTVVGIFEEYADGVTMKSTSKILSEQLTQSSEAYS